MVLDVVGSNPIAHPIRDFSDADGVISPLAVAVAALAAQLLFVRPRLTRRSDVVLAGQEVPRSHAHYAYVALEAIKVLALLAGGILLLAS